MMTEKANQVSFTGLVAGLASTAAAALHQVQGLIEAGSADAGDGGGGSDEEKEQMNEEDRKELIRNGIINARHLIDTLGMLEQKTAGNLTAAEEEFMRNALTDLRVKFVRVSDMAK